MKKMYFKCSNCHVDICKADNLDRRIEWENCPNCGGRRASGYKIVYSGNYWETLYLTIRDIIKGIK